MLNHVNSRQALQYFNSSTYKLSLQQERLVSANIITAWHSSHGPGKLNPVAAIKLFSLHALLGYRRTTPLPLPSTLLEKFGRILLYSMWLINDFMANQYGT